MQLEKNKNLLMERFCGKVKYDTSLAFEIM
jgi:hypothetical protein